MRIESSSIKSLFGAFEKKSKKNSRDPNIHNIDPTAYPDLESKLS